MPFQRKKVKFHKYNYKKLKTKKNKMSSLSKRSNICLLPATMNISSVRKHTLYYYFTRTLLPFERVARFTSIKCRCSLTLEAAFVLPIMTFLCICLMFFCQVFMVQGELQGSLFQAARHLSGNVLLNQLASDTPLFDNEATWKVVCVTSARKKVMEYSGELLDRCACLKNGKDSVQFWCSDMTQQYVDLVVTYDVNLPLGLGMDTGFPIVQRCRMRVWNGQSASVAGDDGENWVYITKEGQVYHLRADCTYLKFSIRPCQQSVVFLEKNDSGGSYTVCEICQDEKPVNGLVYVTDTGDRYHNSLDCSRLKRYVQQVTLSRVEGMRICPRCGE